MDEYHDSMIELSVAIMQVLAQTLGLEEDAFEEFCDHPVSILRLLHYPPQEADESGLERG
jgi:isopenicillin N synthase-like dioxygenase